MAQMPSIIQEPSEKERKYDRQLRIWAGSGQAAIESANILLFNTGSGTVGVETLKNLVLPGIGKFTIIDDTTVSETDLGVNFFLDEGCLGKSRAQVCAELLQELNPEVQSDWFPKQLETDTLDLGKILTEEPVYTLIVHTFPIHPHHLKVLQGYGADHLIPVVSIHSTGFFSYFHLSLPGSLPIVDTHPEESATTDLRLLSAWPELNSFAADLTKKIDTMDNHEHGHIPYVVILLHFLEKWKEVHGDYPRDFAEKIQFRNMVAAGARTCTPEGGEENFDEAAAAVVKTMVAPSIPSNLKEVFEYGHDNPAELKSNFWIIAGAIQAFYAKHGCLPLPGNIPDMKAQSKIYMQLQNIYKAKARQDVAEVLEAVKTSHGGENVGQEEVELFCKNAAFVKLINAKGAEPDRLAKVTIEQLEQDAMAEMAMMPLSLIPIYLALFVTSHSPRASSEEILKAVGNIVPGAAKNQRLIKVAEEVARVGGGELHNTSALTGGMVAQEIIKIITKQFVPIDNTCIFDGISSRCQVLRL